MNYPISFALQIGPAALDNPEALQKVVKAVLAEIKAAGIVCPVTTAPAPVAMASPTVAPAPVSAPAPVAIKGQWESNYGAVFNTSFLRYTDVQSKALASVPPALVPAIREGLAKFCIESGMKNGDLKPELVTVGDEWEWVAPTSAPTLTPTPTGEPDPLAGASNW